MKQVKSTAISVFALALAFMWLAPLVWLVLWKRPGYFPAEAAF